MKKTDLIIIGGGILGTFHAYWALQRGFSVRIFEKNNRPRGATVRNFGQIVPSGMDHKWQNYGRRSLDIYKNLDQQIGLGIQYQGSTYIASDSEEWTLLQELYEINQAQEYSSVLWAAEQCQQQIPNLKSTYCKGALFFPQEISVEPLSMVHRILAYLQETKGLIYHPSTLIQTVEQVTGGCLVTDHRNNKYEASKVIICNGSDFQQLFPSIFEQSDLEISKLQMFQTVPQKKINIPGNLLTGLSIRRYESFQACPSYRLIKSKEATNTDWKRWGVHILFKQAMDGTVIIRDSHEYADVKASDELDFMYSSAIHQYILQEAQKILTLEDWTVQRTWYGQYSQCKTQDIFLHDPYPDIHIVTGIGGKGMTASPGFAEANLTRLFP
jgi:FAD dependent oxidoreductase TIGR03364